MNERTRRRATRRLGLLGLAAGLLLLPLGHGTRADHTPYLTLRAVQDHVDDMEVALAALPGATCGDGIANFAEECDGAHLGGATCQTQGFLHGTLACDGSCVLDTSGCSNERFEDTGLTVVDHLTGLEWEKKTDDGTIHDVDNTYTWNIGVSPFVDPDGTAFTVFLAGLNAGPCGGESPDGDTVTGADCSFSGHGDWRLPEVDELQTILLMPEPCGPTPCIDPIFGPTFPSIYWSASTISSYPTAAWWVRFSDGRVSDLVSGKPTPYFVRAVRSVP